MVVNSNPLVTGGLSGANGYGPGAFFVGRMLAAFSAGG
jgi:hypothetical protein